MKKLDKDLSKRFFNSVEEMNECYGVDAELPSRLYSNTDLVCYEIVEPFVCNYLAQYVFTAKGFHYLNNLGSPVIHGRNTFRSELEVYEDNTFKHGGRCFVYVRVNNHLREQLEKSLIGCEFICRYNKADTPYRRFVHSVVVMKSGVVFVKDQYWLLEDLNKQLFYTDDYSDPIPYKEWVKQINKQDVEVEG